MGKNVSETMKNLNLIKRAIFWLSYYLFARHLPRSHVRYSFGSRAIRAFILKRLFKSVGRQVNIEPKIFFYNMSESEIGDYSGIGMNSYIGTVKIGRDVMIGEELMVISQNHKFNDINIPMRKQGWQETKPVIIKDDVWIGARVIILPGITIGRGSIVGAGSVVTKDVPSFSIVAGNPARIIGNRN
jgi:maltose O-acetyltransferase